MTERLHLLRAVQEVSEILYSFGFWHIWNSKEIHSLTMSNLILCWYFPFRQLRNQLWYVLVFIQGFVCFFFFLRLRTLVAYCLQKDITIGGIGPKSES